MASFMKHHHYTVIALSLIVLGLLGLYALNNQPPEVLRAGAGDNIDGWAWSSNVGWISFNCTNLGVCSQSDYGVNIDPGTGIFSGYAWADNVGWISFNVADLSGCPSAPCEAKVADIGSQTYPKEVSGWAKTLSSNSWMRLRGPSYGVQLESNGDFSGYSWEDDAIGWLSWKGGNYSVRLQAFFTLNALKSGTGINCGADCSESYFSGVSVSLTVVPDADARFIGWSGDCGGAGSCELIMDGNKFINAAFDRILAPSTDPGSIIETRP
jgi:hypothetical protein